MVEKINGNHKGNEKSGENLADPLIKVAGSSVRVFIHFRFIRGKRKKWMVGKM